MSEAIEQILKRIQKERETCAVCGKRITQKLWDSQKPLHLSLEHSLGGPIGSWGDEIVDVLLCSRECFDRAIKETNSFKEFDNYFFVKHFQRVKK